MRMNDVQIINIFTDFKGTLTIKWFLSDLINWLRWHIVKFILWIVQGMEGLWREMFKLFGIFGDNGFQSFLNQFKPLVFTIAVLSIIIFFLRYMKDPNIRLRSLFDTLLIGIALFTVFPLVTTTLGNELQKLSHADKQSQEISYQLVNQYVHDIDVFDKTNWTDPKMSLARYQTHIEAKETIINDKNIDFVDILEHYADSRNGIQKMTRDILSKKTSLNVNGERSLVNKGNGFFGAGREEYYRYSVNYFMIIGLLFFIAIVFALSSIKTVKMIYQLITTAVITFTLLFKDMEDAGIVKKGARNMLGNVMQLVFIYFSMELFVVLIGFLQKEMSGFGYLLAVAGLSLATLDGSFFLQELTGIESGFKSIGQTLQSIYHGSRLLSGISQGIGNIADFAKNTAKQGAKGFGGIVGFGQGLIDGGEKVKHNLDEEKNTLTEERQKEYGNSNLSMDKDNLSSSDLDNELYDTDNDRKLDNEVNTQLQTDTGIDGSEKNQLQTGMENSINEVVEQSRNDKGTDYFENDQLQVESENSAMEIAKQPQTHVGTDYSENDQLQVESENSTIEIAKQPQTHKGTDYFENNQQQIRTESPAVEMFNQSKTDNTTDSSAKGQLQSGNQNDITDRRKESIIGDKHLSIKQEKTADKIPTQLFNHQANDKQIIDSQPNKMVSVLQDKIDIKPQNRLGNSQSILTNVQLNEAAKYALPKQPVLDFKPAQDKVKDNERYAHQREIQENKTLTAVTAEKIGKASDKLVDRYINSPTLNQARDNAMFGRKLGRFIRGIFSKKRKG